MLGQLDRLVEYVNCARDLGTTPAARWSILWNETKNLRVRLGIDHHHPSATYSIPTRFGPLHFRDNFGDITNLVKIVHHGEYRIHKLAHPGAILDVGANIGMAAVWFARHNPDRRILCFEPIAEDAELIRLNCPNAEVFGVAAGERSGTVRLHVDQDRVMASAIPCAWKTHDEEFDMVTLDDMAVRHHVSEVALMKIDTEGMENDILRGARSLLGRTAQVIVETHERFRHDETLAILQGHDFSISSETFTDRTGLVFAERRG